MASDPDDDGSSDARYLSVLYRRYGKRLRRALSRSSGDPVAAEDETQEAYTRLLARGNLSQIENCRDYLYGIAYNVQKRLAKERKAEPTEPLTAKVLATLVMPGDPVATGAEIADVVLRVLESLPPRQQAVLHFKARGYSYQEIGQKLGVSALVIGQDVMHARQKIRMQLQSPDKE
jgi:RNA polymerase sigma factor (sigma-70 family)